MNIGAYELFCFFPWQSFFIHTLAAFFSICSAIGCWAWPTHLPLSAPIHRSFNQPKCRRALSDAYSMLSARYSFTSGAGLNINPFIGTGIMSFSRIDCYWHSPISEVIKWNESSDLYIANIFPLLFVRSVDSKCDVVLVLAFTSVDCTGVDQPYLFHLPITTITKMEAEEQKKKNRIFIANEDNILFCISTFTIWLCGDGRRVRIARKIELERSLCISLAEGVDDMKRGGIAVKHCDGLRKIHQFITIFLILFLVSLPCSHIRIERLDFVLLFVQFIATMC